MVCMLCVGLIHYVLIMQAKKAAMRAILSRKRASVHLFFLHHVLCLSFHFNAGVVITPRARGQVKCTEGILCVHGQQEE